MFLVSAATSSLVGFLTNGIGSKLILYALVIFAWTALINFVIDLIPSASFAELFQGLDSGILYFMNLFQVPFLITGVVSTMTLTMMIRLRKG